MGFEGVFGWFVFMGALFGWWSFFHVRSLRRHVNELEQRVHALTRSATPLASSPVAAPVSRNADDVLAMLNTTDSSTTHSSHSPPHSAEEPPLPPTWTSARPDTSTYWTQHPWWLFVQQHWMVLLGGLCIALAGIFLARYAVQQGYVGPVARFAAGLLVGFLLHGLAEWLRRRQQAPHAALAALAAGGSITLFAMLLVGLHYFSWLHPLWAFFGLAVVALLTLWLARLHGPVLALMGMLGAYVVPLLVSTGSGSIEAVLLYSVLISAAVLALLRFVQRAWLWWGWLCGALSWWLLSLLMTSAEGAQTLYLTALGYLMMAVYFADYRLAQKTDESSVSAYRVWQPLQDTGMSWTRWALLLFIMASSMSLWWTGLTSRTVWVLLPLWLLVLRLAWQHVHFRTLPWWLLASQTLALLLAHSPSHEWFPYASVLVEAQLRDGLWWLLLLSVIVVPVAWSQRHVLRGGVSWMALALAWPLWMLLLSQHLYHDGLSDGLWAALIGLFGLFYNVCGSRKARDASAMTFVVLTSLLANVAYAVALVLVLSGASLTLALVMQCGSLAWFMRRYQLSSLTWLLKWVAAWVLVRLTVMPWWMEMSSVWWTLLTYAMATLIFAWSTHCLAGFHRLQQWAEAATWHVGVLAVWVALRAWVYEGQPFVMSLSLLEAALNTTLFLALSMVYYRKQRVSIHLRSWYQGYSQFLLMLALLCFAGVVIRTLISDYWFVSAISATPVWNTLWLVYAVPMLVALLYARYAWPGYQSLAMSVAGVSAFLFISLQVRHLWQGHVRLSGAYAEGELYTYSAVWLLLALLLMLVGGRFQQRLYQVGLGLLLLVVAKVFLIDLEQLQGVYRILAFMGLGLGLLLVALLHQRWSPSSLPNSLSNNKPLSDPETRA